MVSFEDPTNVNGAVMQRSQGRESGQSAKGGFKARERLRQSQRKRGLIKLHLNSTLPLNYDLHHPTSIF